MVDLILRRRVLRLCPLSIPNLYILQFCIEERVKYRTEKKYKSISIYGKDRKAEFTKDVRW